MKITVIGTGFVGVVTAGVFASFGNKVWGLDVIDSKIKSLNEGKIPFFEPDLEELVKQGLKSGNLRFTTSYQKAITDSDVILIAVGTPSAKDGQADLTHVLSSAKSISPYLKPGAIIALKSTVPPGTNQKIESVISSHTNVIFHTASLPEFLKEGTAVYDTFHPDRIIIGATDKKVINKLKILHSPLNARYVVIKPQSAQMAKYSANAYLAQRITFINQIANLCQHNGADIMEVIKAIGPDKRIGEHYWYPGLGYGGSCFPKDVKELAAYSKSIGEGDGLLVKIDELNEKRILRMFDHFSQKVNGWKNKKVAVLGLSFKPNTDDIREAPSLKLIPLLIKSGARVTGFDPKANESIKSVLKNLDTTTDPYTAANKADVVIILVEWKELINLDLSKLKSVMVGNVFIDTRNQYSPEIVSTHGFEYLGVGR